MDRFVIMGYLAQEHEQGEAPKGAEEQPIYETNDAEEAKKILQAGGFIREGQWLVASRIIDNRHFAPSKDQF
jgi:hypothetical protein